MSPGQGDCGVVLCGGQGAAAGDLPCWRAQEGYAAAAGLEDSGVTFPCAPVTFNAVK